MAFDEKLAGRVRKLLSGHDGLAEKRMFGGLAFLINGNMSVGVLGDDLIVRVAPDTTTVALREPGVRVFDMSGRPMKGWLLVGPSAIDKPASLAKWIRRGVEYASSLPVK